MSEEAVCQTCGNRGFHEALNYCMTCGEAAEHTYCLEMLPEDLSEYISWTCEGCMPTTTTVGELSQNPSAVPVVEGQGTGTCIQIIQEAPCSKRQKTKWCASNSASPKTAREITSKLPCCMMDGADTITKEKVAGQMNASGFTKWRR